MIEVVSFLYNDAVLANFSKSIREEVFVKEQEVPAHLEYDGNDDDATHYIVFYNKKAVGTARWRKTTAGIKLERFAILKNYRNKGVGKILLDSVMCDVLKTGQTIYLHAQEKAVNYYLRAGFKIHGSAFWEAGIKHFKMVL